MPIRVAPRKYSLADRDLFYWQHGVIRLWLPFYEESGAVAADVSQYGNNGTINGASWVDGKIGQALSFDGVNDDVVIANSSSLDCPDDFSISFWFKVPVGQAEDGAFVVRRGGGTINYAVSLTPAGYLYAQIYDGTFNPTAWSYINYADGLYHFVVFVRDTVNDKLILYVDGIEVSSVEDITTGSIVNDVDVLIGQDSGSYLQAIIDEVRIYNRALTTAEILAFYRATNM